MNSFFEGIKSVFPSIFGGGGQSGNALPSVSPSDGGGMGMLSIVLAMVGGLLAWATGLGGAGLGGALAIGAGIFLGGMGGAFLGNNFAPPEGANAKDIAAHPDKAKVKTPELATVNIENLNKATNKLLADRIGTTSDTTTEVPKDPVMDAQRTEATRNVRETFFTAEEMEKKNPVLNQMKLEKTKLLAPTESNDSFNNRFKKYVLNHNISDTTPLENRPIADLIDHAETEIQNQIVEKTKKIRADNNSWTQMVLKKVPNYGPANNISWAVDDYLLKYLNDGNYKIWEDQAKFVNEHGVLGIAGAIAADATHFGGVVAGVGGAMGLGTGPGAPVFVPAGAIVVGAPAAAGGAIYGGLTQWLGRDPNNLARFKELSVLVKDYHDLQQKRGEILEIARSEVQRTPVGGAQPAAPAAPDQARAAVTSYLNDATQTSPEAKFVKELYTRYIEGRLRQDNYAQTKLGAAFNDKTSDDDLLRAIAKKTAFASADGTTTLIGYLERYGELQALQQLRAEYVTTHPATPPAVKTALSDAKEIGEKSGITGGATDVQVPTLAAATPPKPADTTKTPQAPGMMS